MNLKEVKRLGLIIDQKMTWRSHIASVCTKLSRVIRLPGTIKNMVGNAFLLTVNHSLFYCHLSNRVKLWGHSAGYDTS